MNSHKNKKGWIVLKIDIKKAFDTISWNFINHMLIAFNFPTQWIQLINSCLLSMEYTPTFNGTKTYPFKPTRSIRQGNPLLPYIFILAMEYLSIQIQEAVSSNLWKPFKIRSHDLKISHLLFIDDIILFTQAGTISLQTIKTILDNFCNTSGMENKPWKNQTLDLF